jgi:hypothetical protein
MSWTFAYSDYSRHKIGDPKPIVSRVYYAAEDEARQALRDFRTTHTDSAIFPAGVSQTRQRRAPVAQRQREFTV